MVDLEITGGSHSPFFASPELTQRLDLLRHLTENSQLIPVVLGPEGSGKSSLIQQYCGRAGDNWVVCSIEAHPMLQPEALLSLLANTFAVAPGEDLLERLVRRFEAFRLEGRMPVVVLDEAHLLPEATIITLLRLHERGIGRSAQVRILLFGTPELDTLLTTPQVQAMNTQVLQRLEMPRLDRKQTEEYALHLLGAADKPGMLGLSPTQLDKLFRESEGIPGRVEQIVVELVGSGAAGRWHGLPFRRVSPGAAVVGILAVTALLLILVFQDEINALFGAGVTEEKPRPSLQGAGTVELALPPSTGPLPPVLSLPESGPLMSADISTPAGEEEPSGVGTEAVPESAAPAEGTVTDSNAPPETAEPGSEEQEATAVSAVPEMTPEGPIAPGVAQEPPALPAEPAPAPPVVEPTAAPTQAAAPAPAAAISSTAERPAAPPKTQAAPPPAKTVETAGEEKHVNSAAESPVNPGLMREEWLLRQNPKAYTLQLVALGEEAGISRFLERFSLPGQAAYFRTMRQGKPWFSLLYGVYPDRQAALAARARLPAELQHSDVWPRSLASVQEEIRNR